MAGTMNLDMSYIAPFYKTTFEWWQDEAEYVILKGSNAALARAYIRVCRDRFVVGLFDVANGLWIKVELKWYWNSQKFIVFRHNSVSAGTLLNYAFNIQFTFTHHQEYRDLGQLICWFARILLLTIESYVPHH
ncbi:LOW QUALITY PROTEIN: hypothetical protein V1477_021099 [Vespula maculifrons]|uniref:Uncharacterized protein n=1 Tax=Vespula maculifrons TaxID=7453 RepID=A0ABD2AH55_VESMC